MGYDMYNIAAGKLPIPRCDDDWNKIPLQDSSVTKKKTFKGRSVWRNPW